MVLAAGGTGTDLAETSDAEGLDMEATSGMEDSCASRWRPVALMGSWVAGAESGYVTALMRRLSRMTRIGDLLLVLHLSGWMYRLVARTVIGLGGRQWAAS